MFPGMNPRAMQQAMRKMGIAQTEIEADEVIIRCADKDIVISSPQVSKINMMGQETFQVIGEASEVSRDTTPEISDDDVKTVMEQANCDEDKARKTIQECKGDLAQAIMRLSE